MKRIVVATCLAVGALLAGVLAIAAPPRGAASGPAADPPTVRSISGMLEKELRWGMSHAEVTAVYNQNGGLFDVEYAPQLAKLQPGIDQQELEADRDNRKANFDQSYTEFKAGSPTGYDVTPVHLEYTYDNGESVQKLFKDGKNRYFFYIKDKLWKVYDEVPLKSDGSLGASYQAAVTKLNGLFGVAARIRAADASQGLERTEADWQDARTHLRLADRASEHIAALILEDRATLANLASLRTNKPVDPFTLDPAIAALTRKGVADPNAPHVRTDDGGVKKKRRP